MLKNQLTMCTDDLLSNRPQDDLVSENSICNQMFDSLGITWDAISQYELLQSQHQEKQRQQMAHQQQILRKQNNISNPPPRPPLNMMPALSHQTGQMIPPPLVQHQQQQGQRIIGTPAEWDGRMGSAPKTKISTSTTIIDPITNTNAKTTKF